MYSASANVMVMNDVTRASATTAVGPEAMQHAELPPSYSAALGIYPVG